MVININNLFYIIYMFSKYFSHWLIIYFIFWFFGYIFNINLIVEYINPYYTSLFLLVGFIFIEIYNIFIKKYRYELSFLFIKILTHLLPLLITYKLIKNKDKYALINLIIIGILYILYMKYIDRDILDTYFKYKPPFNWKEYFNICKSKEGKYIPYCFLFN
uniref:Uncharacterized protein n=1 Tax=viral metagenome TaxID=1070528 RepID=A0A6C0C4V3_9ZZZZ